MCQFIKISFKYKFFSVPYIKVSEFFLQYLKSCLSFIIKFLDCWIQLIQWGMWHGQNSILKWAWSFGMAGQCDSYTKRSGRPTTTLHKVPHTPEWHSFMSFAYQWQQSIKWTAPHRMSWANFLHYRSNFVIYFLFSLYKKIMICICICTEKNFNTGGIHGILCRVNMPEESLLNWDLKKFGVL